MSDPYQSGIPPVPPENPYTPPASAPYAPPGSALPGASLSGGEIDPTLPSDIKTSGMLCHLLSLAGYIIPFGNIIGPLVVWLTQREKSPFIDFHGKEALNFQITVVIAVVISIVLCFLLIGFLLLPAVGIYALVMVIIASIKTNEGRYYRYPFTLRFIK